MDNLNEHYISWDFWTSLLQLSRLPVPRESPYCQLILCALKSIRNRNLVFNADSLVLSHIMSLIWIFCIHDCIRHKMSGQVYLQVRFYKYIVYIYKYSPSVYLQVQSKYIFTSTVILRSHVIGRGKICELRWVNQVEERRSLVVMNQHKDLIFQLLFITA